MKKLYLLCSMLIIYGCSTSTPVELSKYEGIWKGDYYNLNMLISIEEINGKHYYKNSIDTIGSSELGLELMNESSEIYVGRQVLSLVAEQLIIGDDVYDKISEDEYNVEKKGILERRRISSERKGDFHSYLHFD